MGGGKTEIWVKNQDFCTIFLRTIRSQAAYSSGSRICRKVNYALVLPPTLQGCENKCVTNKNQGNLICFYRTAINS